MQKSLDFGTESTWKDLSLKKKIPEKGTKNLSEKIS
jgi:hypothetical protein